MRIVVALAAFTSTPASRIASEISDALRQAGVLVNAANATTIRIAPALIVTDAQITRFIAIFKKVIADAK